MFYGVPGPLWGWEKLDAVRQVVPIVSKFALIPQVRRLLTAIRQFDVHEKFSAKSRGGQQNQQGSDASCFSGTLMAGL